LTFTTTYAYDRESGKLIERRLPDGQRLAYRYDANDGKVSAVMRDSEWLAWIDNRLSQNLAKGLRVILPNAMTEQAILTDVAWHPFEGMIGAASGNGIRSQENFNKAYSTPFLYS
jgi:YD repeat-containing protein